MSRTAEISAQDPRDGGQRRARPRRRRGVAPRPGSGSSTTCSSCSAATAGSACGSRRAATSRPAPTTRSRTSASRSARRSTGRSATAPGSAATATRRCRWTRRSAMCAIDISGRPLCLFEADLPPVSIAGFDAELAEEFFRAVADQREADPARRDALRLQRPPHDRGLLQGVRRALREAVAIDPDETGRPVHQGDPDLSGRRRLPGSRSSTTAWATCARSRRRSSGSAPRPRITADPTRRARADGARPARRRRVSRRRCERVRELELDALVAERLDAGTPVLGHLPRHAAAVRALDRARRGRGPRPARRRGRPRSRRRGLKVPHIGWEPVRWERVLGAHRGARDRDAVLLRPLVRARARATPATCSAPPSGASASPARSRGRRSTASSSTPRSRAPRACACWPTSPRDLRRGVAVA